MGKVIQIGNPSPNAKTADLASLASNSEKLGEMLPERFVFGENGSAANNISGNANIDAVNKSGFYRGVGPTGGRPAMFIHTQHYSDVGYAFQAGTGFANDPVLRYRVKSSGTWGNIRYLADANNAGIALNSVKLGNAVLIADFTTFNPDTLGLSPGDIVPYRASSAAVGLPWTGYPFSGFITCISLSNSNGRYAVTAHKTSITTTDTKLATKIYSTDVAAGTASSSEWLYASLADRLGNALISLKSKKTGDAILINDFATFDPSTLGLDAGETINIRWATTAGNPPFPGINSSGTLMCVYINGADKRYVYSAFVNHDAYGTRLAYGLYRTYTDPKFSGWVYPATGNINGIALNSMQSEVSNRTQFEAANTVSSLTNIPIDKQLCVVTVSAAGTPTFAAGLLAGRAVAVKFKNPTAADIVLTVSAAYNSKASSFTVPANGWAEISVANYGDGAYTVKTEEG